jgi:glutamate-5-semialdehyde dehydrogenase
MKKSVTELIYEAKQASYSMASSDTETKNSVLQCAAELISQKADYILKANRLDLEAAKDEGLGKTAIDRLKLTDERLKSMQNGLLSVKNQPDPVGSTVEGWVLPNGLKVSRIRVPLGTVGIIYENRPNVTSDAAALCLKSGNAVVLRGSKSAINSNTIIAELLNQALSENGLPEAAVTLIDRTDHESVREMVSASGLLDCVIPRGGQELLKTITANAKVPIIVDGDGNCHIFVDESADFNMAKDIVINAKVQRPGVCNAMETLIVHENIADRFIPEICDALSGLGVEILGDKITCSLFSKCTLATEEDYATEFLDLKLSVKCVRNLDEAISHIRRFSSGHSEAIITSDLNSAERFVNEVDAAAVLVNTSTRFVDGGEFGLGAEIGISTQKLHARGPMGLRDLTSIKYVVHGNGQIRK